MLAVDMSVQDPAGADLNTWTLSDPSDIIGSTVGGNRYGWFSDQDFSVLAFDNSLQSSPDTVYVDDDWSAVPAGTDPDGGGPANLLGFDAFATIQGGVDAVAEGGTVDVAAGSYAENVILAKSISLQGALAGTDARGRAGTLDDSVASIVTPTSGDAINLQGGSAGSSVGEFTFDGGTHGIESTSGPIDDLRILNSQFVNFSGSALFLNNSGDDITVHQNVVDGSSSGSGGLVHLDQDSFDGFHLTSNFILNGDTGFFVDGTRNVGSSASRDPLFHDNLFSSNGAGAAGSGHGDVRLDDQVRRNDLDQRVL